MRIRIAVFDVDGVIYPFRSAWQRIHAILGVDASLNKSLYRAGLINYDEWGYVDTALWVDLPRRWVLARPIPRRGLDKLCRALTRFDVRIAVSGGLNYTGEPLRKCFDYYITNELVFSGNDLVGVRILVREGDKAAIVGELLNRLGFSWGDAMVVGDSENDVPMMRLAAYSIAFNPVNDYVARSANVVIRGDLTILAKYLEILK